MYNDNDKHTSYNREVNNDPNQNNYREVPTNTETINNRLPEEYRDGYVHGRVAEHRYNEVRQVDRDNNNAARGLILGIVLSSLLAIPALAYYFWNRQNQEPVVTPNPAPAPIIVPSPSPQPEKTIIQRERVIERNPEVRVVPVPQGQAPTTPAPNINIEQPAPAPNINIEQPTPAPQPNVNITVPPTSGEQQSPKTTEKSSDNSSSRTATQELPSIQSSPSPEVSGNTNSDVGDRSNTRTPGNNASPSPSGDTSPAQQ